MDGRRKNQELEICEEMISGMFHFIVKGTVISFFFLNSKMWLYKLLNSSLTSLFVLRELPEIISLKHFPIFSHTSSRSVSRF
jgi:hypothetical protein